MKVSAKLKHLNISPRKVRIVVNTLRGLGVGEALGKLSFTQKRAARPLSKLLHSAIANAENNFSLDKESLKIDEFRVDGGPILKRFRPKSRGMAAPIWHRTSHITVTLDGKRVAGDKPKPKKSRLSNENIKKEIEDPRLRKAKSGQEVSDKSPNVSTGDKSLPATQQSDSEQSSQEKPRSFEVEKKVGSAKNPSFVKKFFRRKSI